MCFGGSSIPSPGAPPAMPPPPPQQPDTSPQAAGASARARANAAVGPAAMIQNLNGAAGLTKPAQTTNKATLG